MDYLNRDSFYTGVSEGKIGSDRIIEMMNVVNGDLVIEEKGVYSIEKFIVARRIMYWQVYLHKTVVAAEFMLIHILRRAKELAQQGKEIFASPALAFFLQNDITAEDFKSRPEVLEKFAQLDDYDILGAVKVWQSSDDNVLSELSRRIIDRQLFKIEVAKTPFSQKRIDEVKAKVMENLDITENEVHHFVITEKLTNNAYNDSKENINLMMKSGKIMDVSKASDNLNISALSNPVEKYFLSYPVFSADKPKQLSLGMK
jgi:HD superfamily phosphohydrolase